VLFVELLLVLGVCAQQQVANAHLGRGIDEWSGGPISPNRRDARLGQSFEVLP
jgi:hypothetical protein